MIASMFTTMKSRPAGLLLSALLFIAPAIASAGTVQIEAGKMTLYQKEGKVEFTHKVHLVRETMQLDCDHLIAYYSEHQLTRADADGHVVIIQDKVRGHAERATLDHVKSILTLSGKAVLEQDGNRIEGETIVHNLELQKTIVTPVQGGRIHMSIESEEATSQ